MGGKKKKEKKNSTTFLKPRKVEIDTGQVTVKYSYSLSFSFTSHNIHYITPITRHCHANNLPSTEQAAKTQPKQDQSFSLTFRFVA